MTLFARRALDTGDDKDFVIQLDKEFSLGYAFGTNINLDYPSPPHSQEASFTTTVTLKSDGTPLWGTMPEPAEEEKVDDSSKTDDDGSGQITPTDDLTEKEEDSAVTASSVAAAFASFIATLAALN